jgi:hypothetical protein
MKKTADDDLALKIVHALVMEWDPYSLLASGCPRDEFAREIASVVSQIPRIKSVRDATLVLSRVFTFAFEPERFTPDECAPAGAKLFAALESNGLVD